MLRVATLAARERLAKNVRFLCLRAEDIPRALAPLRLVTFGNSFHWTDRFEVANALFPLIARGGGLVAIASSSVWAGREPWKLTLLDTMNSWLGPELTRRATAGRLPGAPFHQDVLRKTPFGEPRVVNVVQRHAWTSEALVGLLYSSSLQLKHVLGNRTGDFERDLCGRLMRLVPNDRFEEDIEFTIISARKT